MGGNGPRRPCRGSAKTRQLATASYGTIARWCSHAELGEPAEAGHSAQRETLLPPRAASAGASSVTTLLGYLPQHTWEVVATTLAVFFVGLGLVHLVTGRVAGEGWQPTALTVRVIAAFQILLGVGVGLAGFLANAEPPCGQCGDGHWGGPTMLVFLGIWLAGLGAILASIIRKYRKKEDGP
jgi:hypothetical protein